MMTMTMRRNTKLKIKFYDTCALLNLGEKVFGGEPFAVSSITFKELETIKTSFNKDNDVKAMARHLLHLFDENEYDYIPVVHQVENEVFVAARGFEINNDTKILSDAIYLAKDEDIEFVTADLSLRCIARHFIDIISVEAIAEEEDSYTGYLEIECTEEQLAFFYEHQEDNIFGLLEGQYLALYHNEELVDLRVWRDGSPQFLNYKDFNSTWFGKVVPYNGDLYQKMLFDSLNNNQLTLVRGPAGSGKAQPNSTLIPTKNGYKKLGEIHPGDKVLDRYGNETTVLNVYPQGLKENFKLTFSDGRVAYCNDEHIWSCYTSKGNLKDFTVKQMIEAGLQQKCGDWRFKIPTAPAIEFTEKQFSVDPYVMGVFLGDGCCKEAALTLSSNDEEIVEEISKLVSAIEYHKNSDYNYSWTFYQSKKDGSKGCCISTKKLFAGYEDYIIKPAYEKSIPPDYKFGSIEQRYALLQGLMDTDGTIDNAEKGRTRFNSTSLKLIQDVQELCWSLGMSASISQDNRPEKYTTGACYSLTISCTKEEKPNLFRLSRKKEIAIQYMNNNKKSTHSNKLTIKAIEKMPHLEEMTCLYVDNPEHLYLTEQYIVTHNTLSCLAFLMSQLEKHRIDKIIVFCNTVATMGSAKLGFYPGTRLEKLLDSQIGNLLSSKLGGREGVERLIDDGKLELLPLSDIRGLDTNGMKAGIYISEAQNLDRALMKLAIQRVGEDCICLIDGDSKAQVDDLRYAGINSGMRRLSQVFRGQDFYGEVELKHVYRSRIAEVAERF